MNVARFVRFLAAALITAVQWATLLWLLEPSRVEAAQLVRATYDDTLPTIVVTAQRYR